MNSFYEEQKNIIREIFPNFQRFEKAIFAEYFITQQG